MHTIIYFICYVHWLSVQSQMFTETTAALSPDWTGTLAQNSGYNQITGDTVCPGTSNNNCWDIALLGYVERTISTVDYTNVELTYSMSSGQDLAGHESCVIEYSTDGSIYTNINTISFKNTDISSALYNTWTIDGVSALRIRLRNVNGGCSCYFNDLILSGTTTAPTNQPTTNMPTTNAPTTAQPTTSNPTTGTPTTNTPTFPEMPFYLTEGGEIYEIRMTTPSGTITFGAGETAIFPGPDIGVSVTIQMVFNFRSALISYCPGCVRQIMFGYDSVQRDCFSTGSGSTSYANILQFSYISDGLPHTLMTATDLAYKCSDITSKAVNYPVGYIQLGNTGQPTSVTNSPTFDPSISPTMTTQAPSTSPTTSPTNQPSKNPTAPTVATTYQDIFCILSNTCKNPVTPSTTVDQKGSTSQFGSFFEDLPFWAYIIAAVILCCLLQTCYRMCCKKKREPVQYFPTATGINNGPQPQIHSKPNDVIQPQQQLPVVFVTPQQKKLMFPIHHAQVPSHSVVDVPTDIQMQVIAAPQNNLIVNPSAPMQDDELPNYDDVAPPPYEEDLPAYEEINREGGLDNNHQQETNC